MAGSPLPLDREGASERIRKAAIALFKTRGYHGTPVRALARIVRIEAASLYYHFPSKQEILFDLFEGTMDDLLEGLRRATGDGASPEERLRAAVRFHVLFHTERRDEAFVSHSELRSLSTPNLRRIIGKRDRYEAMFRGVLADGVKAGVFEIADIRLTTIAILTMCSCVSDWFSPDGRLDADPVADRYADMVFKLVSPSGSPRSSQPSAPERAHLPPRGVVKTRGRRPTPVPRRRSSADATRRDRPRSAP